ncbi:MAG: hypothetical protein ACLQLE_00465 [Desulfobaccales bacterium]
MSSKEGVRRLTLLVGLLGMILGGFVSYQEWNLIVIQKANHKKFEKLANSEVVQRERNRRFQKDPATGVILDMDIKYLISQKARDGEFADFPSKILEGGISEIDWNKDLHVSMIKSMDGEFLLPIEEPGASRYLLMVIYPAIGFLLFWGAARIVGFIGGWVVAGFKRPSE